MVSGKSYRGAILPVLLAPRLRLPSALRDGSKPGVNYSEVVGFMEKIKEKALKLANKKIAFVGSVNENNMPNIKAMSVAKHHGLETFYFASSHSEVKTEHYKRNFNACVYFNDGQIYKELVLEGIMKIFNDIDIKKLIWKDTFRSAFKNGGINDPDYCVLKFTAKRGHYHTEAFEIE